MRIEIILPHKRGYMKMQRSRSSVKGGKLCVCVCVLVREGEERKRNINSLLIIFTNVFLTFKGFVAEFEGEGGTFGFFNFLYETDKLFIV